jgi:4-azaleucine resistance transporter AzlC|tara:strand:- start:98 stop:826 length:729 start_codon:yes stop_codon:yes gene_type:complete
MATNINKSLRRTEFYSGIKSVFPILIGVIPFGLIFGILGLEAGFTSVQTLLMSSIIFAGASQVVFVQLFSSGALPVITILSVGIINLRHFLYSAAISKHLAHLPIKWKIPLAYLLTDEAFAVSIKRMSGEEDSKFSHYYLLGSGITLWLTWQVSTLSGILLEKTIPEELNLGFAIPLVFLALIAPDVIKYRSHAICALSAGTFAIIFHNLPLNLWIIVSAIIGLLVGAIINKIDRPKKATIR